MSSKKWNYGCKNCLNLACNAHIASFIVIGMLIAVVGLVSIVC